MKLIRVFLLLVLGALGCNAQLGADYHSPSESLLPFFADAIDRFRQAGASTDKVRQYQQDAQNQVNKANEYARSLIAGPLRAELTQYQNAMAEYGNAAQQALQSAAWAKQLSVEEHRNDWLRYRFDTPPPTQRELQAQAAAFTAEARAGELRAKLETMRQTLNQKFSRQIQTTETAAQGRVVDSAQQVTNEARARGVTSQVRVKTTNPGAVAHFQTLGERVRSQPGITAGQLTSDGEEPVPIGIYYVWTERKAAATSDKDRQVTIIEEKRTIEIAEN